MQTIAAHLVVCDNCGARGIAVDGGNVHDNLNCRCCGSDHTHAGPDGATVGETCRTVTVYAQSVVVPALSLGGEQ